MARVVRKTLPDGRIMVVREDGSSYVLDPQTGQKTNERGPDPTMAEAFATNDTSTLDDTLAWLDAYENSAYGRRANQLREQAYDEDVRRYDQDYGLRARGQRLSERNAERDFGLREREADARIQELERRFGLDVARFGNEYLQTSIAYAKTPRSWVDALLYERGAKPIFQQLAGGNALPAFGAKGAQTPQMNSASDAMASLGINIPGAAGQPQNDPAKAIQAIIKNSPPSDTNGFNPQDVATIQLLAEMYRNGAGKLKEGTLESADPDEIAAMQSVFDYVSPGGGNRFLRDYQRTRIPGIGRQSPYAA